MLQKDKIGLFLQHRGSKMFVRDTCEIQVEPADEKKHNKILLGGNRN